MPVKSWMLFVILILILSACSNTASQEQEEPSLIQTSTTINQSAANHAKEFIQANEDYDAVYAVNTFDKIVIAVLPKHHDRFQLEDFRKELESKLDSEIRQMDLEVTTDKKIALELEKIEERMSNNDISKHQLEKEIDRIIQLSKEET